MNNKNITVFITLFTLAIFNALGNGAITANGGSYIIAALGALLSLLVMTREASELSGSTITFTQEKYNGMMAMLYIVLPLAAIWIMHTFILPVYCPTLLTPTTIVLVITALCVTTLIAACEYSCSIQKNIKNTGILRSTAITKTNDTQEIIPFFDSVLPFNKTLTPCITQ